jgi:hypothetical protein
MLLINDTSFSCRKSIIIIPKNNSTYRVESPLGHFKEFDMNNGSRGGAVCSDDLPQNINYIVVIIINNDF